MAAPCLGSLLQEEDKHHTRFYGVCVPVSPPTSPPLRLYPPHCPVKHPVILFTMAYNSLFARWLD